MSTSPGSGESEEIPELASYPPIMTVQQVAEVLQVNDQVVRRRLNEGEWPGFRAGSRDWRMRRLAVRAIILGSGATGPTAGDRTLKRTSGDGHSGGEGGGAGGRGG